MYAKVIDNEIQKYPFSIKQLKMENPNTSFLSNIEVDFATLAEFNVVRVFESSKPAVNSCTHKIVEGIPEKLDERWYQKWDTVALSEEEAGDARSAFVIGFIGKTQSRLDMFAASRNYDGILGLCTYATSTVPKFQAEGQCGVNIRDATWEALYRIMAEIESGARPMPSSYEEIEVDLPALVWSN